MVRVEAWFRKNTFTRSLLEFGISIRPLWWVARAFVAWVLVFNLTSATTSLLVLALFIFLSVQWGRKKWFTNRFFAALLLPLNLLAIVLSADVASIVGQRVDSLLSSESMLMQWPATDGLRLNGEPLTQIKAVDRNGKAVAGLKFLDGSGNDILSNGLPTVVSLNLPDLTGKSLYSAQQALALAGFQAVDVIYGDQATENNSVVDHTDPVAGKLVTTDVTITLYLVRK